MQKKTVRDGERCKKDSERLRDAEKDRERET